MSSPNRIIIDTDPGVDDVLAMLLAFSALPSELDVLLIAVTYGNTDVRNCLRNVVSLFHIIEKEKEWRRSNGKPEGFDALKSCKPIVAVGPEAPLLEQSVKADFFHGIDGLGGIHTSHPHLSPSATWQSMFKATTERNAPSETITPGDLSRSTWEHTDFTPSTMPAHREILRLLAENPAGTISIVAIGPMTNVALAAAEDVETFLRVKEVIVMGGAIDVPGNPRRVEISPLAEFNTHCDPTAMARILALTSHTPSSTMPPTPTSLLASTAAPQSHQTNLPPYPSPLPSRLRLTLFPLDITTTHILAETAFTAYTAEALRNGSPLAEWCTAFLQPVFKRSRNWGLDGLSMHDPLCVWYAMTAAVLANTVGQDGWDVRKDEDIRVETLGQWTHGACVVDRRGRRKQKQGEDKVPGDHQGWLSEELGNCVDRVVGSPTINGMPGKTGFETYWLKRVFG